MADNALTRSSVDTSIYHVPEPPNMLTQLTGMVGLSRQATAFDSDRLALAQRRIDATHGIVSSVLADPSRDNIMRRAAEARAMGLGNEVDQALAEFDSAGYHPDAIKRVALRHLSGLADVRQRLELGGMGSPQIVDDGDQKLPVTVKSGLGAGIYPAGGAPIANRLGPDVRVRTQESIDPASGGSRQTPLGELYDDRGNLRSLPVRRGNQVGAGAGVTPAPGGQGDPATAGGGGPASFPTSLPPATAADIAASAKEFNESRDDLTPGQDRAYGLRAAIGALRETNTGLGTEGRQRLANFINALPGDIGKKLVPDSNKLSDYDLAQKYLTAAQMNRAGAGRSDAALRTSGAASPNTSMTRPAAIEAATVMLGQELMKQAQVKDYIGSGRDPGGFANHRATEYAKANDPKAFALAAMSPDERAKYVAGLSGEAKTRFLNSVRLGLRTGVLTRDDIGGGVGGQ
jgi:hypothetical protein